MLLRNRNIRNLEQIAPNGSETMPEGTVKWFNYVKGFGFIGREQGDDLFVHTSEVEGRIGEGDLVEFEVGESPKGPNAINVRKIGDAEEE